MKKTLLFALLLVLCAVKTVVAGDEPPHGLIVASVDDSVVVSSAQAQPLRQFATGPVGWLYPAPGGVVFAPDVVDGTTTVIDLRSLKVVETLDGVTTPIFGPFVDRYLVVTGTEVLAVSYPDRARIFSFPLAVASPWQAVVVGGGSSLLVLDRAPDGGGPCRLLAADLLNRKAVYGEELADDVTRMVFAPELGVLAMAVPERSQVQCVEPRARQVLQVLAVDGRPRDVAVVDDGRRLAVAVEGDDGDDYLALFTLRLKKKKGLVVKKEERLPLAAAPQAAAADYTGRYLALATADQRLLIVDCHEMRLLGGGTLPGVPRDLAWWTATAASPHLPMWSDQSDEPAELPEPMPN